MGAQPSAIRETTTLLPTAPASPKVPPGPTYVPGRSTILASSIVFVVASVLLLCEFVLIVRGASAFLVNLFGALEGIGWFAGFALLLEWQVAHFFPAVGFSRRALTGCTLKLVASVFFNVQPFSWLVAGDASGLAGLGVPWSNFVGIWFFHTGNTVDALGMYALLDCSAPLKTSNLPATGMWTFWLATWLLVAGDSVFYVDLPAPYGLGMDTGFGDYVAPLQIAGSALLLIGSCMYAYWAQQPMDDAPKPADGLASA